MADKPLLWLGSSLEAVRAFPDAARRQAGYELNQVQAGLEPSDWKPMTTVGAGVQEIRISVGTAHRIFYVAKFAEGIYVLHAFEKRSRQTAQLDIELGQRRYQELVARRRVQKEGK
jgi:phage-related protein